MRPIRERRWTCWRASAPAIFSYRSLRTGWLKSPLSLCGLYPATAEDDISDLYEMEFDRIENPAIYLRACELSRDLNHHLFDTPLSRCRAGVAGYATANR